MFSVASYLSVCVFHCGVCPFYQGLLHTPQARTQEQECWGGNQWRGKRGERRERDLLEYLLCIRSLWFPIHLLWNIHTLQKFNIKKWYNLQLLLSFTFVCIQSMGMRQMSEQIKINSLSTLLYLYESSMVATLNLWLHAGLCMAKILTWQLSIIVEISSLWNKTRGCLKTWSQQEQQLTEGQQNIKE